MTVITTSTAATATAYSNQRKIDRCQNGVLWAIYQWQDAGTLNRFYGAVYSTDNGASWTTSTTDINSGGGNAHQPSSSFFIDLDDYAHFVYKNTSDGYVYYKRGTPNAARTAWTWSAATKITAGTSTSFDFPDVIAHREGTGWRAHVVWGITSTFINTYYCRIDITSGGAITIGDASQTIGAAYNVDSTANPYPSIDFNHTGDGKTVAGSTPHLYVGWSAGKTGSGFGIRFKKATYSGGSWTWGTEREIDSTRYVTANYRWLNCMFDGTRVVLAGEVQTSSTVSLMLYERDAADTTTTTRELVAGSSGSTLLASGSASYDGDGNVYLLGQDYVGGAGAYDVNYRKWTRATTTLGAITLIDTSGKEEPYLSAKRGYSNSRIEFIYTDGTASPYNVTYGSISLNAAPNAPTTLTPDGVVIDKDATQRFSWTFSDPDTGDSQSAYDLRYRLVGAGTWTTVSGGATQYHDFVGGTFAAGDYEWEVRTYDAAGLVGPYSSTATFTAAAPPSTPTITDPTNGGTVSTENYTVEWSASSQEKYQVRTVADAAGSPDTGTVYQDTGTVTSSSARARTMAFDTNLRAEHVQVRVQVAGLWSAWASVSVNVSYTLPATPTLVVTSADATASISIAITNPAPAGSEPAVTGNDVWVRVAAGGRKDIDRPVGGDGVRLSVDTANNGTFVDRAPRANTEYEYRVRAQGDNDVSSWSAWTPVA